MPTIRKTLLITLLLFPLFSNAQVSISEIFYSPKSNAWVEIYNNTDSAIDLTQYKIFDVGAAVNGHAISVSSGTNPVPAHTYAVLGTTGAMAKFGTVSWPLLKSALAPAVTGDTVTLKQGSTIVDSVTFSSTQGAAGDGNSLQKSDSSWISAVPTPGAINATTPSTPSPSPTPPLDTTVGDDQNSSANQNQMTIITPANIVAAVSTHYSYLPLSYFQAMENISVSAGRDRLATVGSPLNFKATTQPNPLPNADFTWSFGDGTTGGGDQLEHAYLYPGDYTVTVHVSVDGHEAISRAKVKVVEAALSVSFAGPDRVEVSNNSTYEANLFGWKLVSRGTVFTFPQDTIILPGTKLSFDTGVTGLHPVGLAEVILASGSDVTRPQPSTPPSIDPKAVALIKEKLISIRSQLNALAVVPKPETVQPSSSNLAQVATPIAALPSFSTSTLSIPAQSRSSWLGTFKHFFGIR